MLKQAISVLICSMSLMGCSSTKQSASSLRYEPEEVCLTGVIERKVFPGPPNYADVSKGDEAEVFWILKYHDMCGLSFPNVVKDDGDKDRINVTAEKVYEYQLVLSNGQYDSYRHLLNQLVQVRGTLFHQPTAHHHLPDLVKVEKMEAFAVSFESTEEKSREVARLMKILEKGDLLVEDRVVFDGWSMPHPKFQDISRSQLYDQCQVIIPYGRAAVPELLKWLEHKETYMRYIAARSLKEITGLDPTFYTFGKPNEVVNGDKVWFEKAKQTWKKWYEKESGKK
jgi:hypothetical protein